MKKETMLDLMGKIDDSFIEEAAHPEILLYRKRQQHRRILIQRVSGIAACMVIAIGVVLAVPYMRASRDLGVALDRDEMINAVIHQSAEHSSVNKQSAAAEDHFSKAEAEYEKNQQYSSEDAAQIEASKAAAAAAAAAASASKAAADAAATAASASIEAGKTTSAASTTLTQANSKPVAEQETQEPQTQLYTLGEVSFEYSEQTLFAFYIQDHYDLKSLVIPSMIEGVQMTELAEGCWDECVAAPNLQSVTVPECIQSFGNPEGLSKSVVMICAKNSTAEAFFLAKGYSVRNS